MLAGLRNASRGKSNKVLLTRLGGGAFGNDDRWIDEAMIGALDHVAEEELEVLLVSYGAAPENMLEIARRYA